VGDRITTGYLAGPIHSPESLAQEAYRGWYVHVDVPGNVATVAAEFFPQMKAPIADAQYEETRRS
jgi:hypothetical protein